MDAGAQRRGGRAGQLVLWGALLALLAAGHLGRRAMIRSFFVVGAPSWPPERARVGTEGEPRPVRVVLVDGMGLAAARALPRLGALCGRGVTLTVDVGWPSVSLPVQHALWTGVWQTQSGVLFALGPLPRLRVASLPGILRARGAVAVADSHPEIVRSFPFSRVVAPGADRAWSTAELARAALAEVRGAAPLVFVHLLAVDVAGHRFGGASPRYAAACRQADRLLGQLAARRPRASWIVLADHGHLAEGGHGGSEDEVRLVRACVAGPGVPAGRSAEATIVDLTRVIADRANVSPPPRCQGRTLAQLLAREPPPLPPRRAPPLAARVGGLALVALWVALLMGARRRRRVALALIPWPLAAAAAALVLVGGAPSLSRAFIYPAWPTWHSLLAAAAGAPLLVLQCWAFVRAGCSAVVAGWLAAAAALVPAAALVGWTGWPLWQPPLIPELSAWAAALLQLALLLAAGAAPLAWISGAFSRRGGGRSRVRRSARAASRAG